MTAGAVLFGLAVFAFFVWMVLSSVAEGRVRVRDGSEPETPDESPTVARGTGMLGGDITDAYVAQHALDRARRDGRPADLRDVGAAIGMQQQYRQDG
ncbi:MAG: hypothetical protein R3F20_06740 [Planctomycetota bacterium]